MEISADGIMLSLMIGFKNWLNLLFYPYSEFVSESLKKNSVVWLSEMGG